MFQALFGPVWIKLVFILALHWLYKELLTDLLTNSKIMTDCGLWKCAD